MERDFMGLRTEHTVVKEEVDDVGFKEKGFCKSSAIQGSCSNKVSVLPYFMPFGVPQDNKINQTGNNAPISSGFRPVSAAEFPVSCQVASVSATNPFFRNQFAASAQNLTGTSTNTLLLGGIPISSPHSVLPIMTSIMGFTGPENNLVSSGSPQLTIFYAGAVNVFENVTPEKAQDIMFLAGNGSSIASVAGNQQVQAKGPNSCPDAVLPDSGTQSESMSSSPDKTVAAKSMNFVCSFCPTSMIPSVPQARKASLARFLEKRRERIMNAAPYTMGKKFIDYETGESSGMNYSATSAA